VNDSVHRRSMNDCFPAQFDERFGVLQVHLPGLKRAGLRHQCGYLYEPSLVFHCWLFDLLTQSRQSSAEVDSLLSETAVLQEILSKAVKRYTFFSCLKIFIKILSSFVKTILTRYHAIDKVNSNNDVTESASISKALRFPYWQFRVSGCLCLKGHNYARNYATIFLKNFSV